MSAFGPGSRRWLVAAVLATLAMGRIIVADAADLDTIVQGGRVIDPESGLDAIRDVGIADGRITRIEPRIDPSALAASGRLVSAAGSVVTPGFIDLHEHGQSDAAHEYQVHDGVTTALELEWGYGDVASFLASRQGKSRVHFGASVSHAAARALALADDEAREALRSRLTDAARAEEPLVPMQPAIGATFTLPLDTGSRTKVDAEIARGLAAGGLGIGVPVGYYPGADRAEILALFQYAARESVPIFTHVRTSRESRLDAVQEVLANAASTGAPLHIHHLNSMSLGEIDATLALIDGARRRGIDVTAEAYPYTGASTTIDAWWFGEDDWQQQLGIDYGDLQWQATGERLTAESFERYRKQGGVVIMHTMKDAWIDQAIANDWVMIASDGMPYAKGAHPRGAGTFSRVLGRYVRERGLVDLPTAIRKMTLLPAQRLESIAPQMKRKGRVQVGADADLVVFDPESIIDTATYETGPKFSEGIDWVFVAGEAVVANGDSVPDAYPGQAIVSKIEFRSAPDEEGRNP